MSKCDLQIDFDGDRCRFRAGERVRGTVTVQVDADCRCDGLNLTRGWRSHGRGNTCRGDEATSQLFAGEWRAGQVHRFAFDFVAPSGPATYHGHLLNVDWYLEARADIPWAIDPKTETELLLEPTAQDSGSYNAGPRAASLMRRGGHGVVARNGMALFGAIVALGGVGFALVFTGGIGHWAGALIPAVFVLVGAALFFSSIWNRFAQRRLGKPSISIRPQRASPGTELKVDIGLRPRAALQLNSVKVTLFGGEEVVSGSGTRKTTHRHTLYEIDAELLAGGARLQAGESRSLRATLAVPPDAPLSFAADDNKLYWQVRVHIDIERWPDWREQLPIAMVPAAQR